MKENILNYIPLKIYRYLRWKKSISEVYRYNKKSFSKEYADICLNAAVAEHKKLPVQQVLQAYEKKDQYIIRYLENLCSDVIEQYKNYKPNLSEQKNPETIWVFWWTGENSAPDIVKACINSIRKNANGHNVIFLDQTNFAEYVVFPEEILKKHKQGKIGHAHFSDMLRISLLAKYGGMWIDATVFLSQPIPQSAFSQTFYSLKTYDPSALYYSKSRWCGYFLAGNADFLLFPFIRDCLVAHWLLTDHIIDYLLMDYLFGIAYKHFDQVKLGFDQLSDNNTKRGLLMAKINEPYSPELFDSLSSGETFASKLSWRYGNPTSQTKTGELTNYGHLLDL